MPKSAVIGQIDQIGADTERVTPIFKDATAKARGIDGPEKKPAAQAARRLGGLKGGKARQCLTAQAQAARSKRL